MPLDEIVRNSAPAIGGLLVTAVALFYTQSVRRRLTRARPERHAETHRPAE